MTHDSQPAGRTTHASEPEGRVHIPDRTGASLDDVISTIREFETASVELIAWEYYTTVEALELTWREAIDRRLITPAGLCWQTGERLYAIAAT